MNEISKLVKKSYDRIAVDYYTHRDLNKFNDLLDKFVSYLSPKAHVLDAGCGAGIPSAKFLVDKGIKVTGIDLSDTMLNLAKKNVVEANFIKMDINILEFEENSFDGIISVFTLFHIPREKHLSIFENFHKILKEDGILMINTGINESEGRSMFFGEEMFWSNYDPKKTLELVKRAGFSILYDDILVRGGEYQYWIFAKKS